MTTYKLLDYSSGSYYDHYSYSYNCQSLKIIYNSYIFSVDIFQCVLTGNEWVWKTIPKRYYGIFQIIINKIWKFLMWIWTSLEILVWIFYLIICGIPKLYYVCQKCYWKSSCSNLPGFKGKRCLDYISRQNVALLEEGAKTQ